MRQSAPGNKETPLKTINNFKGTVSRCKFNEETQEVRAMENLANAGKLPSAQRKSQKESKEPYNFEEDQIDECKGEDVKVRLCFQNSASLMSTNHPPDRIKNSKSFSFVDSFASINQKEPSSFEKITKKKKTEEFDSFSKRKIEEKSTDSPQKSPEKERNSFVSLRLVEEQDHISEATPEFGIKNSFRFSSPSE